MTHYNEVKTCRVFGHQVRTLLMLLMVLGGGEAMAQVTIHGSVYGGGNQAAVKTNTSVNISDGRIVGTIDPDNEGKLVAHTGNVYGGGKQGDVEGTTEVNICAKESSTLGTYEALAESTTDGHGVQIDGNVFGGGEGSEENFKCDKAMVGNDGDGAGQDPDSDSNKNKGTTVRIGNGTIGTATTGGDVYGGGEIGRVEWNTQVMIGFGDGGTNTSKPEIKGNVFGAGKGVSTHGFSALVRGNSTVTIAGDAQIGKNVYGGGQIATVGRYVVSSITSRPEKPASGGTCTVTIQGNAVIGTEDAGAGDVFGAGKGVLPYEGVTSGNHPWSMVASGPPNEYPEESATIEEKADYFAFIQTLGLASYTVVTIDGDAKVKGSVYGGSENGFLQAHTSVKIQGSSKVGYDKDENPVEGSGRIYGGGRGDNSVSGYEEAGKVRGNTNVTISNGSVNGSVFGGGEMGYTIGSANVTINGGTINHDVYGGGALADTNTGKEGGTTIYVPVPGLTVTSSVEGLYENTYIPTNDKEPVANKTYYADANGSPALGTTNPKQSGYYEWSENVYTESHGTAQTGKIYYTLTHPTTVNLLGGLVKGDAYGGGLGQLGTPVEGVHYTAEDAEVIAGTKTTDDWKVEPVAAADGEGNVKAIVYGDINVNLGSNGGSTATAFDIDHYSGDHANVVKSGRVFGCNNLNGSPQGNVTVTAWKTVAGNTNRSATRDKENASATYELAAVYGGGNLANYTAAGKKTHVIINGCSDTSIKYVYGGGNAAAVPEASVDVNATYEIGYVFGGGNGADEYTIDNGSSWITNPGANVNGNATTMLYGGVIHEAFGGSNEKGAISGSVYINTGTNDDDCPLSLGKLYGAGKNADIEGDLIMVMGCMPGDENKTGEVYGGAENANVKGNVELTITSGSFGKVFGGNNQSGAIFGHIKLNIEETGCTPIKIDELYLGGNDAAYSVYGYYQNGTNPDNGKPIYAARTSADDEHTIVTFTNPNTVPDATTHQYDDPELTIISATHIGKVFGGGLGEHATLYGNPTVNINQIYGKAYEGTSPNQTYTATATTLGNIGDVFGGGNAATVEGNTTVNIGTETSVTLTSLTTENTKTVLGANITGSVYGGGSLADVTGSTQVVICATEGTGDTYNSVAEGTEKVTIAENVFGAGQGDPSDATKALVRGNTNIVIGGGAVKKSVYGGGELSQVGGDTDIRVMGGTIGTDAEDLPEDVTTPGAIYGNIYGGGQGNTTNVRSGLIKGNTNITVSGGEILHNIYGGGAHGSVGTFTYANDDDDAAIDRYDTFDSESKPTTGVATINITGGTFGTDGHNNGMIFGSSRGDIDAENTIYDNLAWVYDTHVNIGTEDDETDGPTIWGSVYGSGENGHTYHDAAVTIYSGVIGDIEHDYAYRGNVYGGGCGTDKYYSSGTEKHDGNGDTYNRNAGIVNGDATVIINGGSVANNVYGAGSMGKVLGSTSVTINTDGVIGVDGAHDDGNVYGAARGEIGLANDYGSVTNSSVTLTKGTVKGSLYGGGKAGPVNGAVTVTLNGGTVNHDVYGGGALAQTNSVNTYEAIPTTEIITEGDNKTDVDDYYTRSGAGTEGDPYQYTLASGKAASGTTYYRILNTTNVTLSGSIIEGNLYGGGLGRLAGTFTATDPEVLAGTKNVGDDKSAVAADVYGPITVTVSDGRADNVFGCNNINGSPKSTVTVNITGTTDPTADRPQPILNVYGGGNQAAYTFADEDHPLQVNISGGVMGNVFGGGLSADVAGGIEVNVSGGKVVEDVYGGGALANTNTANWENDDWKDQTSGTYYAEVKHLKAGESSVNGYYTRTGDGSNEHPYVYSTDPVTGTAVAGTTYCKKIINFSKVAAEGTKYETFVNLTGGTVGNAYGGGLGQLGTGAIPAMVYGDVTVIVNGTAFTSDVEYISGGAENVAKHGRVFGCNNLNGTPKGKVTVYVNSTKHVNHPGSHVKGEFEIQGVYGGGNLADYVPQTYYNGEDEEYKHIEFGQKSKVYIDGCTKTSINKVYGGGNAASVPFTDVEINGAFEIGYVFGGGNGGDKVNYGNGWETNPGANVPGYTNVMLKGGTIGQAFGGSDTKGTVGGTDVKQETNADCPLHIVNLYGAGNGDEANSEGDINIVVSACGEGSEIQNVFGGSYKANIKGSVTLTITSGIFTSVYGGNDRMGSIGGPITVNIEETDDCSKPIIIQNLYGGCYQTAYPGVGAKDKDGNPYTSGNITVNVKSATRIDRIYGGSENGAVTGNTTVNINMVEGSQSGHTGVALPSYYGEMEPSSLPSNITVTDTEGGYVEVYGLITNANADATNSRSSVVGYYTKEDTYSSASTPVEPSTTYYERLEATNNNYYPVAPEKITVGTTNVGDEGYFTKLVTYTLVGGEGTLAAEGVTYYNKDGDVYTPVDVTVGTTVVSSYYTKDISYPSASGTAEANTTYYRLIYNYSPVSAERVNEETVTLYYTKAEGEYESAEGLAVAGTNYFKKAVKGNIATGIGTIGDVFGGGNKGNVSGNSTVNIVTESTVTMESLKTDKTKTVLGADITGDVFGGGNLADVQGNTYVNICTEKNGAVYNALAQGTSEVKIGGNVYGGGKGDDDNFFCDKGMVGENNTNQGIPATDNEGILAEYDNKGTHIHIGNGTIGTLDNQNKLVAGTGNVYGGGMVGRVEYHSVVEVGLTPKAGVATSAPEILGNVFGGGKGVETHGYAALLRGHTNVTVQQNAKVRNSVYGGGEISTIGRFWIKNVNNKDKTGNLLTGAGPVPADIPDGMPYKLRDGGKCTVSILDNAEIGPTTAMAMPTFEGNVFGAGKGFLPKVYDYSANDDTHRPRRVNANGQNDYFVDEAAYLVFVETQALVDNTDVTIGGNAFVKGSVYGGSENGRVLNDTHVHIAGGQIGWGKNASADVSGGRHPASVWAADYDASTTPDLECPSWTYDKNDPAPYDPFATADGDYDYSLHNFSVIPTAKRISKSDNGKPTGKDGHTYYGNVFGGGSGKDPYKPGYWHRKAGAVGGNTYVNITGGHILTSVYGGNEHTDVGTYAADNLTPRSGGKCTVNMVGGTLGVPRTLAQIAAHPVTCYLFGAGKGDQRIFFNTWTNVIETEVNISGNARIYGSTFGGGEDGHVIRDAETNIGGSVNIDLNGDGDTSDAGEGTHSHTDVKIGTWGTSYVDGNVFGGGRGFSGEALTAGTVGGNTTVNISNGTMLGSVYGGGRLASVGTHFTNPNDDHYGQFNEDVAEDVYYTSEECTAYNTAHELESGDAGYLTTADIKTPAGSYGHVIVNISGGTIGNGTAGTPEDLTAGYYNMKYSGNVFGGSMGRITLLDGTSINPMWPELAQAKTSIVNITGASTRITRNVYGGGEFGTVRENAWVTVGGSRTTVGSYDTEGTIEASGTPTIDGSVFGGGYGSDDNEHMTTIAVHWNNQALKYTYTPMQWAGDVGGNTYVSVKGGNVKQNVYGGGELASVGIINYNVNSDAPVGITTEGTPNYTQLKKHYRHSDDGKESYTDFGLSWPYEFTYVPCNPTGFIGGQTNVNITGGTIGDTGSDEILDNTGYVFGGGKGKVWFGATETTPEDIAEQRYREAFCANVRASQVTIGTGASVRTVYGGGEDGHVYTNANVIIDGGTIARSVFGGGKGEGIYKTTLWVAAPTEANPNNYTTAENQDAHSWTAGRVYGNTNVTMNGGSVGRFIYGGGNLASVGKGNYASGTDDYYPAGYGEMLIDDESTANIDEGRLWTSTYDPNEEISETNKPDMAYYYLSSGKSTVTILGGRVGPNLDPNAEVANEDDKDKNIDGDGIPYGSVFGGSRGMAAKSVRQSPRYRYMPDFFLGYVNQAFINIGGYKEGETTITSENTPTIVGSVYGGGQDGHVRNSTEVKVFKGNITGQGNYETAARSGHIFGAGSGIGKYIDTSDSNKKKMHYGSGSVTCTTLVEVSGGTIAGNVYGGGALATVGPPRLGESPAEQKEITESSDHSSMSHTQVDIKGGTIRGSVYGASRGPSDSFYKKEFLDKSIDYDPNQFATDIWSTVNISGGSIAGNVYGGGEGGRVTKDTEVNLTGGAIAHDAFGGGKGTINIASDVGGDVTVKLNEGKASTETGCSVKRVFGCNDLHGTPKGHVQVLVYATQHPNSTDNPHIENKYAKYGNVTNYTATSHGHDELTTLAEAVGITSEQRSAFETAISEATDADKADKLEEYRNAVSLKKYDVEAVYGGGNLAPYEPTDATLENTEANKARIDAARTEVIIEGCQVTSIKQVYGGGNAASTPATLVRINEAYEIDEVFGGGNGKDSYQNPRDNNLWYQNPGANVGYKDFTKIGSGTGSSSDPKLQVDCGPEDDLPEKAKDASTPEKRLANYGYGSGVANTVVVGGRVHMAYGGSNTRGNISKMAMSVYQESGTCDLIVDKTYGAGKDAETDAQVVMNMECVTTMDQLFGGSTNADVNNDIYLKVTNGTYNQVFGGNDTNGAVNGSITVIVEESGCTPIEIKELYAGGYLAPYSIYGYKKTGGIYDHDPSGHLIPLTSGENPKLDPHINVISATKIGDIYGGGYKADVVGSPRINVNMTDGMISLKKVEVTKAEVTRREKTGADNTTLVDASNNVYVIGSDYYDPANVFEESSHYYVYKDDNKNSYKSAHVFTESETKYVYASGTKESFAKTEDITELTVNVKKEEGAEGVTNAFLEGETWYVYKDEEGNTYAQATVVTGETPYARLGKYKKPLSLGYIGNIFGGGNEANIYGDTYIDIGTGKWIKRKKDADGTVTQTAEATIEPARNKADIKVDRVVNDVHSYYGNFKPDGVTLNGGFVFGGGNQGDVTGNTHVKMGDGATVENRIYGGGNLGDIGTIIKNTTDYNYKWVNDENEYNNTGVTNVTINGGTVGLATPTEAAPGNVFGGGKGDESSFYCEKGMVYGTNINITNGTVKGAVYGGGEIGRVENNTAVTIGTGDGVDPTGSDPQTSTPTIEGNVFGGGKGLKTHGYSALVRGNPTVTVQGNAKLMKSVYGGGEIASVGNFFVKGVPYPEELHAPVPPADIPNGMPYALKVANSGTCTVTIGGYAEIGPDNMVMTKAGGPDDTGYVFGAGKGILPGDYTYADKTHKPTRMAAYNAAVYTGDPGTSWEYASETDHKNVWEYFGNETAYLTFIETLAMTGGTEVTVGDHAFVKGSVYGGSENGHVLNNTKVTIEDDCQIGNGYIQMTDDGTYLTNLETPVTPVALNRRYTDAEWEAGHLIPRESDPAIASTYYQNSLPECASWPYGKNIGTNEEPNMKYLPYDVYDLLDNTQPASNTNYPKFASDGHTFYGNVFGGGSGYYPYRHRSANKVPGETAWSPDETKSNAVGQSVDADGYSDGVWLRSAGAVFGNTEVIITGGHILTSVYGGNEMTDVGKFTLDPITSAPTIPDKGGTSKVTMSGGTLGVPRTLGQIAAHPVTCYLFGAGKGDQRINFNTWTNVNHTVVEVTNEARIYGSVFGGGEDGHVLGDVSVDIKDGTTIGTGAAAINYPLIGTTGTSYVDGNIFGGGRGFSGEALTAGTIGGNVTVNISDGTMLGSVYGGGRLASVGTRFTSVDNDYYGQLQPDEAATAYTAEEASAYNTTNHLSSEDEDYKHEGDEKTPAKSHGHVTVNISGGIIGNDLENKFYVVEVETSGKNDAQVAEAKRNGLQTLKNNDKIPNTDFELYDSLLVGSSTTNYKYLYRTVHTKGGNVYGGSMGRLTLLDNSVNPYWPKAAVIKTSKVNISGTALIKGNVYGGGELGMVRGDARVTIGGILGEDNETITSNAETDNPTILRDVFGGGYGSEDRRPTTITAHGFGESISFTFTPMQLSGIVCGDAYINMKRGWVKKNLYGGGEMATVGLIDFAEAALNKHESVENGFGLSWPYKLDFRTYDDTGESDAIGGATYINVYGGRLGITGKDFMGPFNAAGNPLDVTTFNNDLTSSAVLDKNSEPGKTKYKKARIDNGDIYGGGKGKAGDRYDYAFCANVKETHVTINYDSSTATPENYKNDENEDGVYDHDCIAGAVYGGGENGHVIENTEVILKNGLIGHAIYGGGSGKGKYSKTLQRIKQAATDPDENYTASIYSVTAGKVYGNTKVKMEGGFVVRNIYGGGNMGSIGKGNYSGGADDYSAAGYGETLTENLWSSSYQPDNTKDDYNPNKDNAWYFMNSGKTEVEVTGGQVGYVNSSKPSDSMKDGLPYGNIFGGCRGEAAPNIQNSPRYEYSPEFFSGYVNESKVIIGKKRADFETNEAFNAYTGPTIYGSVYGGGQDGHVRRDTYVTVNKGEIGMAYNEGNQTLLKTPDRDDPQWLHRGNVYGAGSGISKYEYDLNYNGKNYTDANNNGELDDDEINTIESPNYYNPITGKTAPMKEVDYSTSAGSVTRFTTVDIYGGTIHRNVYGGGSMASVGAPKIPVNGVLPADPLRRDDSQVGKATQGKQSLNQVNIASKIGTPDGYGGDAEFKYTPVYGGEVYGASRGIDANNTSLATSIWTEVNLLPGTLVQGNVYGGGDNGMVKRDADVNVGTPWTATITEGDIPLTSGSKTITIKTKDKWTVTSDATDGIEIDQTSGEGDATITVRVSAYTTARTIHVTVTGTGRSQTFTIEQK